MTWINKYPVVSILLVLVACARYEYHTESSSFVMPGLAGGLVVLGIVGIVLVYRIFNAVEKLCRTKGWLKQPLTYRYDVLIPIGILAVAIKASWWGGPTIEGIDGELVDQWVFHWSDEEWDVHFIIALIAVVLLLRILELIRGIELSGGSAVQLEHKS